VGQTPRAAFPGDRRRRQHAAVIEDALRFIDGECHRANLALGDVARHVRLTPSHLDRLLTRYTGFSFTVHRTLARLERASQMLLNTPLSVKEIAAASGYNYVSTFDRAFARMFRHTPTEWRDRRAAGPLAAAARRPDSG
jgi:AraC-like DNA-binding protein